jgi:5-carboxymethyl-2-hydroxymuconate isomerase
MQMGPGVLTVEQTEHHDFFVMARTAALVGDRLRACMGPMVRRARERLLEARSGLADVAKLRQRCTQLEAQRVADGKEAKADMHCVRDSYKRQTLEMMAQIDALRAQLD